MEDPRLDLLLHRLVDGGLTVEEAAELDGLVLGSPSARRRYWELTGFHALVREWGTVAGGLPRAPVLPTWEEEAIQPRRWTTWILAAAAVLTLALASWSFWPEPSPVWVAETSEMTTDQGAPEQVPPPAAVAVLTQTADVIWSDDQPARSAGTALAPGWIKIERGLAQIAFYSGAHVILEGPAQIEILSENGARVTSGRFSAHVPEQASGFEIHTPKFTITDLGTAFGCDLAEEAEIHVFSGRIKLSLLGGLTSEWNEGQAARLVGEQLVTIPLNPKRFSSFEQLAARADAGAQLRLSAWRAHLSTLSADPATLVHYTFETDSPWDGTLHNQAAGATAGSHGSIVGATWSEGRWPGKRALEFKSPGDRVRLSIPGLLPVVTCLAWVRVDGLPNQVNSLFSAVQGGRGAGLWELTDSGGLAFRVRADRKPDQPHFFGGVSSTAVSPLRMGQWVQLATVYDVPAGTISHYVDGMPYSTLRPQFVVPISFLKLELGNWRLPNNSNEWWPKNRPVPQRNFVGRFDELLISSRALSAAEIRAHYEAGRP